MIEEGVLPAARSWDDARPLAVARRSRRRSTRPSGWPPRIARGRELFQSAAAQCVKCHGPSGRRQRRAVGAVRRLEQAKEGCHARADPSSWPGGSGCRFEAVASAELHAGEVPRRRPADRPVLADLRGHQGHADAAGRPRPRQPGRASARRYLARRQLRAVAGEALNL